MSQILSVIWIDWYAYHVARFRALAEHPWLRGRISGVELVGGSGVHQNMVFRFDNRGKLPIETLLPGAGWADAGQIKMARMIWRKLDQLNPAAVLVPGYYTAPALAAALWAKRHKRKAILMTETTRDDHRRVWWKEAGKGGLVRSLFDGAIAGGSRHVNYLRELHFPSSRIGLFYDVVDNDFFRLGTERLRKRGSPAAYGLPERYFLYVGRLASEKNLEMLIRAYAGARQRCARTELVLVGDGPLRGTLERQVRESGLGDCVHIVGLKSTEETLPYYAFAHGFVLPSQREPWGLVVNEALAAGLPVIVSNRCGCAGDLVGHGTNGLLFDATDENQLTESLCRMDRWGVKERATAFNRSEELLAQYSPSNWAEEVIRIVRTVSIATAAA